MRGYVQGDIFGGPFGSFGRGPCHWGRFGLKHLDFEGRGWPFHGPPGFAHGPWKHHGFRGHRGRHGSPDFHDRPGYHGHHKHHRGHHHHHHRRSESPECYGDCRPRSKSPGPRSSSPCCRRQRAENSSPERREPCERHRRGEDSSPERRGPWEKPYGKGKRCCKGPKRGGPWRRRSFDGCRSGPYDRPECCKKCCQKKRSEETSNECDKNNESTVNRNENSNTEAVLYERVVVENTPRATSD